MSDLLDVTVGKLLERTAGQYGDNEAVVYHELGLRHSYREFEKICRKAARGFMSLDIKKGNISPFGHPINRNGLYPNFPPQKWAGCW